METFIIVIIVGMAVIYLVKRYLRIFRPRAESSCDCGCTGCGCTDCGCTGRSITACPG